MGFGGRPTKYDPRYCEMLIEHMASGLSYESFAGVLGITRATLYNWEIHGEFLDAKEIGSQRNLLFWEKAGNEGLWDQTEYNDEGKPIRTKKINATVWIFSMKNRHKWRDRQDLELQASGLNEKADAIRKMSTAELKEHVKKLEQKS